MVQDQLVDYITAQTKLGTSREVIKTTLQGVGWQAADIDDSFKKIDGAAAAKPATLLRKINMRYVFCMKETS